tara:strand:+ start:517 stop:1365 length:849 start_codon:yes stop_codon:yes gene_type:complete
MAKTKRNLKGGKTKRNLKGGKTKRNLGNKTRTKIKTKTKGLYKKLKGKRKTRKRKSNKRKNTVKYRKKQYKLKGGMLAGPRAKEDAAHAAAVEQLENKSVLIEGHSDTYFNGVYEYFEKRDGWPIMKRNHPPEESAEFRVGQWVDYYSNTKGGWIAAKVLAIDKDNKLLLNVSFYDENSTGLTSREGWVIPYNKVRNRPSLYLYRNIENDRWMITNHSDLMGTTYCAGVLDAKDGPLPVGDSTWNISKGKDKGWGKGELTVTIFEDKVAAEAGALLSHRLPR